MTRNKTTCRIRIICYSNTKAKHETAVSSGFTIDVLTVKYPNILSRGLDSGQIKTITDGNATLASVTDTKCVSIKKGTNVSASTISGKFITVTMGAGGSKGYWMDVFKAKSNGNGKGAISSEELYTTRPPLKINTVFYTVGSDGPLMIDAGPSTFHGPTSDDGHTFFVMDIDTSDRETGITIGLKTSR